MCSLGAALSSEMPRPRVDKPAVMSCPHNHKNDGTSMG